MLNQLVNPAGLSAAQARDLMRRHGPNLLVVSGRRSLLIEFLSRFRNPLVLLLLAASAVSYATGEAASSYVIAVIVSLSVTLDFAQEHRAERAIEKLRSSVSCTATLLRDGVAGRLSVACRWKRPALYIVSHDRRLRTGPGDPARDAHRGR